ncbi:MAG TPA: aldehyde dehydrogenase family protein [Euzebyales bacterium]|nr:aldehyde dehydrogenase family protein [Euzebyales bacterium]
MDRDTHDLWIEGRAAAASTDDLLTVDDPATGEAVGHVPACGAADVDRAVDAARHAFNTWRWLPANERADMLHEAAARTAATADILVDGLLREQGKARPEQEEEVEWSGTTLRYYAELARNNRGRVLPSGEPRTQLNLVLKEPYGVVGAIIPWNFPLLLLAWKLAPALAAGNTVVVKPSELTPLTTLEWIRSCFDHLPPGVVNVVTGNGPDAGEALVRHPDVPVIAMTGSVATGQRIAGVAAPMMKHTHLELGGKDAFVVAPDASVDESVEALAYAALFNAGQVCTSAERIYVPSAMHDEFVEAAAARAETIRVGDPRENDVDMGPMAAQQFRDKVGAHIDDAVGRGATVVTGGGVPEGLDRGWFYSPTVVSGVDHDMVIMRDETFGPVMPIMAYDRIDEAIAYVNDSTMGLGATLRSSDPTLIKRFFEEVKVGTVWINDPLTDNFAGPFGGMKLTGGGRELGEEGLASFQETKHVHWDLSGDVKDWWYPY